MIMPSYIWYQHLRTCCLSDMHKESLIILTISNKKCQHDGNDGNISACRLFNHHPPSCGIHPPHVPATTDTIMLPLLPLLPPPPANGDAINVGAVVTTMLLLLLHTVAAASVAFGLTGIVATRSWLLFCCCPTDSIIIVLIQYKKQQLTKRTNQQACWSLSQLHN